MVGQLAILILAAGASSRMGGVDKLTKQAGTQPLLALVLERAMATGLRAFVTLPSLEHARAALVHGPDVTPVAVPDWREGMAASIRAGIAALPGPINGIMILPGDMPDLTVSDLRNLSQVFENNKNNIIRATGADGTPGHPVIFPGDLFADLLTITGDQGARGVIRANAHRLLEIALPGRHALVDLDTPGDWADWHAARK